jgi:hypothetical protein
VLRYLIKLDRLKIIELLPGNRMRLKVARNLSWRPGGPIHDYLHRNLVKEFLAAEFSDPRAEFCFYGAVMSDDTMARIKRTLQNTLRECMELTEKDAVLPLEQRNGGAYVLAFRPWTYSGFDTFLREPRSAATESESGSRARAAPRAKSRPE